jgi:hypothetical protein
MIHAFHNPVNSSKSTVVSYYTIHHLPILHMYCMWYLIALYVARLDVLMAA